MSINNLCPVFTHVSQDVFQLLVGPLQVVVDDHNIKHSWLLTWRWQLIQSHVVLFNPVSFRSTNTVKTHWVPCRCEPPPDASVNSPRSPFVCPSDVFPTKDKSDNWESIHFVSLIYLIYHLPVISSCQDLWLEMCLHLIRRSNCTTGNKSIFTVWTSNDRL